MREEVHSHTNLHTHGLIDRELRCIGDFFINKTDFSPSIGLYGGETGTVLLLAQFYLCTRDNRYVVKLSEYLDELINMCDKGGRIKIYPYFSSGLAGFGWLLCYLRENNLVDFADDYLRDIDDVLQDQLTIIDPSSWDLLHGRLGIARYFIKRNNRAIIENELEIMRQHAIVINGNYKWLSKKFDGNIAYDTGLAHGMAGILYFVGKCYETGIKRDLCLEFGDGIMQFYKHIQQDYLRTGSFYPNFIPVGNKESYVGKKSRLAWCYGDLGILYSMYLYCMRTHNSYELDIVLNKLLFTADREDCVVNHVLDAMLCHGSSGIAHIYARLYFFSKNERFREASEYWLEVSTKISNEPTSYPPYKFLVAHPTTEEWTFETMWSESLSLLEGVAGVGLSYLSYIDSNHMGWDEILMLY